MTVAATDGFSGPYVLNGSTVAFPFDFDTGSADEVQVKIDDAVVGSGFTVAVNSNQATNPGGTVTFASAPAGSELIVLSDPDFAQQVGFTDSGPFLAEVHDEALDQAARRDIALRRDVDQAIRVPLGTEPPTYADLLAMLAAGRPGGNIMSIPSFETAGTEPIDDGTNLVRTASFYQNGDIGGAYYVADVLVTPTWLGIYHDAGFIDPNGRAFRLLGEKGAINPFMLGARDCTGHPKLSDEVVYDCSDALDVMWAFAKYMSTRNEAVTCDWSMARGLGLSRTWNLHTDDGGQAIWNRPTFNLLPGRLVALSRMEDLVSLRGGNFQNLGSVWELWGGTDTQLNGGNYGTRLIENGMKVWGMAGARMGDVVCQGAQLFAVAYDHENVGDNNSIPVQWGRLIAIQCGSRNTDTVKPAGTYTSGSWLNHPADNNLDSQRHLMTLPLPTGISPLLIKPFHQVIYGTPGDDASMTPGIIKSVESVDLVNNTATVKVWPYQPVETGGQFLLCMGGALDAWGSNLANTSFELIEAFSCALGVRYSALYCPKIGTLLTESTLCSVQLGGEGGESMEGLSIEHYHFESVFFTVVDYATCSGAVFGVPSNLQGDARGDKFTKVVRLGANTISGGGAFVSCQPISPRGMAFKMNGGTVEFTESFSGKGRDLGGSTNNGAIACGNAPENRKVNIFYCPSSFTFSLFAERSLAHKSVKDRTFQCIIYGPNTAKGNAGNITFQNPGGDQAGITFEGDATFTIAPGVGAIFVTAVYEPPNDASDNGNWGFLFHRILGDYVAPPAPRRTGLQSFPIDPLSTTPYVYLEGSDLSTLSKDNGSGGFTAAAAGDQLNRIADKSTNLNHILQATAGNRPKLRKIGSLYLIEHDGIDDFMQSASFAAPQPYTMIMTAILADNGGGDQVLAYGTTAISALRGRLGIGWTVNAGADVTGGDFDNRMHSFIFQANGASSKLIVDEDIVSTSNPGTNNWNGLTIGASNVPGAYAKMLWSGFLLCPALSDVNALAVAATMGAMAGK